MMNAALVEGEACSFVVFDLQLYYGYLASLYSWMWSTVTNVTPDAGVTRFPLLVAVSWGSEGNEKKQS